MPAKSLFLLVILIVLLGDYFFIEAFSLPLSFRRTTARHLIDPSVIPMDVGIAVVSAAAGAVSQLPRIQELEREVESARMSLTEAENQLKLKIEELDEKLFTMDKVYEAQTDKFKKQYDAKMKEELESRVAKMKVDYQYNLEIKLEEQKSKMLAEQLDMIAKGGLPKQNELLNLRINRDRISKANEELENALKESKQELARLQAAAAKRNGSWWPFFK